MFGVVFCKFNGFSYGGVSTCNKPDNTAVVDAKCWRAFAGINYTKATAGASSKIKKSSALMNEIIKRFYK